MVGKTVANPLGGEGRSRGGFTLVEALVAMLLSTLVVGLVTSVFLAQNEFYSDAVKKAALHESVRGATSLVSAQIRGIPAGGIVEAESDSMTFRAPLVVGGVCGVNGGETYLHFPLGGTGVDGSRFSGYAVRDDAGAWSFTDATWSSVFHSAGVLPAQTCALAGADTTGATEDFYRLDGLAAPSPIRVGTLVMLYRESTLRLGISELDSTSIGLFFGSPGETASEFTSGLTPGSGFEYRFVGQRNWRARVPGGNKDRIATVRFSAIGAAPSSRMGRDSLTYNLTVTVPLRNGN